ncbi:MAG: HWE histidine kinase domain-containing protein [Xanthobacteraceae bacterium]
MQTSPLKSPFNKTGAAVAVRVLRVTKELRCHPLFGYTMAFVFVALATLLQRAAGSLYENTPFLTIFPAIIVAALIGGRGPGFLAAILAGGSQWTLFIPALHWLAVASYAVDATICVMLIDYINRTLDLLLAHIDREKQAKQHQSILAKELHHRIQNLFTVIQGVVRFSLPGDGMVHAAAVRERLMDRLQSMSAANRAITDSMGDGVHLLDLISGEIRGFEAQFEIGGTGRLLLGAQLTQDFSLILHELVTNALKYGALSVPQGRVSLRFDWIVGVLSFTWQERGGPPVAEPEATGFGSRILGTFARSFSRKVEASYALAGLRYMLQIESDEIRSVESASATSARVPSPPPVLKTHTARRPRALVP